MRLITIALCASSYLAAASAAAAPHGLGNGLANVAQSVAAANSATQASNASANGAAHAASNSAAAASAAANSVAAVNAASNASANGAANAAANSAAAASAASSAAAAAASNASANGAANAASNSAAAASAAANSAAAAAAASNASANGAAQAAANSAAAASAASSAAAAATAASASANGAAQAAVNSAAAASAASSAAAAVAAANASANGAAQAAANSAAAASSASSAATAANGAAQAAANSAAAASAASSAAAAVVAANASANGAAHAAASSAASSALAAGVASNASVNGAAHAAPNSTASSAVAGAAAGVSNGPAISGPPGLASKGGVPPGQARADGVPPGLADSGRAPPGQAKKDGVPPGLADSGGVPPGQAKKDSVPPGLADSGGVPPGQAKKDGVPPGLADNGASSVATGPGSPPPIVVVETSPASTVSSVPAAGAGTVVFVPTAGDPSQGTAQASLESPADPGGAPTQASARNARSESDQEQKVAAGLSSGLLEVSRTGAIVRKGQILAIAPTPASLATARGLGYAVVERLPLDNLGLRAVVLRAPSNLTSDEALGRLQAADPRGGYTLNPIYALTGRIGPTVAGPSGPAARPARGDAVAVGLIDTGVFVQHPALAAARLEQQGFAPGGLTAAKHGTAVASIAAGQSGDFHGVAPGSRIYVADVYGQTGAGGSASAVAEGIAWLVRKGAPVINISLVGPSNKLMEAAVQAAIRKGVIVVAAVGNDGPNSPPLYPAAYRGVVAVTAVDQQDHILFEAVRATPVAFAAPGADIFAADGVGGFAKVRGTSFASPIVAGQLALGHRRLDGRDAQAAIQKLKRAAKAPTDATFGFGIVGEDARLALRPGLSHITTAEAASSAPNKE